MKNKILVYGAGAIGRGYIPWIFPQEKYELSFVESNFELRRLMQDRKEFATYRTKNNQYEKLVFKFKGIINQKSKEVKIYDL